MSPEGEQKFQSTRESRPKPLEPAKFDILNAEELAKQAEEAGYKTTEAGDAARAYLNSILQGPRHEAVKKLANVLPEFFTQHPKIERKPFADKGVEGKKAKEGWVTLAAKEPKSETAEEKKERIEKEKQERIKKENRQRLEGIKANKNFHEMLESFRRGYNLEFKEQDIIAAWDIANEYLDNQPEPNHEEDV